MVFPSEEMAVAIVKDSESRKLELNGHRLFVVPYRSPVGNIPRCELFILPSFLLRVRSKLPFSDTNLWTKALEFD